ncbi:MAG: hypothetical protein V3W44_03330 [Dehalococcoidales bacterium]
MKEKTKLIIVIGCGIIILLGLYVWLFAIPKYKWRRLYIRNFRDAKKVLLYSYVSKQTIWIDDRQDISSLWEALDLWKDDAPVEPHSDSFAYIAYPIEDTENPGEMLPMEFPIYIHRSGTVLWGIPPEREHYWHRPALRDVVIQLCQKHGINIAVDPNEVNLTDFPLEKWE